MASAIADYAAKQKAFQDRDDAAVEAIIADVQGLNDTIKKLQDSQGQVTPEDQALLDDLTTRGEALANKLEALDQTTPPTPPTA